MMIIIIIQNEKEFLVEKRSIIVMRKGVWKKEEYEEKSKSVISIYVEILLNAFAK